MSEKLPGTSEINNLQPPNPWERIASLQEENTRLREENTRLREENYHDPLTGLLNSRGLEEAMTGEDLSHYALIYCDATNFKEVNDTYSHIEGDQLLRAIAKTLKKSTRKYDKIARVGGDEFVIWINRNDPNDSDHNLLEEHRSTQEDLTDPAVVSIISDRLTKNIKVLRDKFPQYESFDLAFGVVEHRVGDNVESMIRLADEAMKGAKEEQHQRYGKKRDTTI